MTHHCAHGPTVHTTVHMTHHCAHGPTVYVLSVGSSMNTSLRSEKSFLSLSDAVDGSRGSPFQPVHGTGFGYGYNAFPRSTSEGEWPDLDLVVWCMCMRCGAYVVCMCIAILFHVCLHNKMVLFCAQTKS